MSCLKLLVVEDDMQNLELMTEVLSSLEAEVRPVSDSHEAAILVNQERFDGVFLDLQMPLLDGFALAERVRASCWNKSTPIVIVTGREERDTMRQAFATGATFFLQKPVDRHKLIRLFRTVQGTMVENRRRCARVSLQTEVTCSAGSKVRRGRLWNLSEGGIQVEVDSLKVGETIQVAFRLPVPHRELDREVEALGTVMWANKTRQGIQFAMITGQNQQRIREFIGQAEGQ
jgi:CheY-like chemotaxis protein